MIFIKLKKPISLKKIKKRPTPLLLIGLFLNIFAIHSQSLNNTSVLNWFDNKVGTETLPISNGKLHFNLDRTLETVHRYYNSDKATKGSVGYNSQNYSEVNLKYDIYEDEIILELKGESGLAQVILIKEKTQYFKLDEKKFVNLNFNKQSPDNSRSGYYEENQIGKNFIFYIKHYKKKSKVIKGDNIFLNYTYNNEFLLFTQGKFTIIKSKSNLLKLLPAAKNKINDYYMMNRKLKKENETRFMENLMRDINNN